MKLFSGMRSNGETYMFHVEFIQGENNKYDVNVLCVHFHWKCQSFNDRKRGEASNFPAVLCGLT